MEDIENLKNENEELKNRVKELEDFIEETTRRMEVIQIEKENLDKLILIKFILIFNLGKYVRGFNYFYGCDGNFKKFYKRRFYKI